MELRDYQEVGVLHLRANPRAGLFLDMGLGKTATVLTALEPDQFPVLVVAPKRVAERVWPTEGKKWRPDVRIQVAAGTKAQRERVLRGMETAQRPPDVVVIGRDNLRDIVNLWPKENHPFKTVVLDELSSFKNRGSIRWKTARKILSPKTGVSHVWGLTGTPSPNGLHDLWAQVGLLDNGKRCGTTLKVWRENYFTPGYTLPNGVVTRWNPRPGAEKQIYALIEDICLSMKSEGRIVLPEVTYNDVEIPFDRRTAQIYKTMKRDLLVDMEMFGGGDEFTAQTAAALSNRLAQVTAGFLYSDEHNGDFTVLHRNKAYAVQEIVEGSSGGVLVLYRYLPEKAALEALFKGDACTIDTPGVLDAWDAGNVPVLLAHPASVGHGLNLQYGGHTTVWSTATWSLEEWEQTNKRLARQGQTEPCIIHTLSTPGTVDAAVLKALMRKGNVQQALLEHLESPL